MIEEKRLIHSYDNEGYYTGDSFAQKDPLEEGKLLLPANATFIRIPNYDFMKEECKFEENNWLVVKKRSLILEEEKEKLVEKNEYGVYLYYRNENDEVVKKTAKEINAENKVIIDAEKEKENYKKETKQIILDIEKTEKPQWEKDLLIKLVPKR